MTRLDPLNPQLAASDSSGIANPSGLAAAKPIKHAFPAKKLSLMQITQDKFGKTTDGTEVHRFRCENDSGLALSLIDYGAIVTSVEVPDRTGQSANITLGFETLDGYLQRHPYFGATVGRYCNRIANGSFVLAGKKHELATNNGPNHLHGGDIGFDRKSWNCEQITTQDEIGIEFTRVSPAGEEGYPGNLTVTAAYTLTSDNELKMVFSAQTDAATPLNLTNHCYWNLAGSGQGKILDHELQIEADQYLAVDPTLIPTGELAAAPGTPLDFTQTAQIGSRIDQMTGDPGGYDHCYALRSQDGTLKLAARVREAHSGRVMEVYTTQPGIQFYTGNFLDGTAEVGGFHKQEAFCLETQHYPNSPNQADFPSTILKPGEKFEQTTVHRFSAE
ncbi:MAG: galactose mutarotase [Planctomycetaceae bacterium]|nr:galactose mutarotase [Planctomycetaceae bacterium]